MPNSLGVGLGGRSVVDWAARREDWHVVEPVIVWMVHLALGDGKKPAEVRGTLSLGDEGLEFVERKTGADVRFDYTSIRRAKRLRGSPVLLVDWRRVRRPAEDGLLLLAAASPGAGGPVGDDRAARAARSVHARDAVETSGGADEPRVPALDERHEQGGREGLGGGGVSERMRRAR